MYRITFLANSLIFLLHFPALAQTSNYTAVASALAGNVLYANVSNPLEVAVSGLPCEQVHIKTNQGTFRGNGCFYLIKPSTNGKLDLHIFAIDKKDTVLRESKNFNVVNIPAPAAYFAGKTGTSVEVSQKHLSSARGILAMMQDFPIEASFEITGYDALVVGTEGVIQREHIEGNAITPALLKIISEMEEGDMLFFEKIKTKGPGDVMYELSPISFRVTADK